MPKIGITETVLRDAHQSLIATRMTTDDMLPALEKLDKIGFWSLECWGGATFDSCLRFLNEDPWQRLKTIRKMCPNTKLQMLFRGQNMLGYRHYADDTVDFFVKKSIDNGIDVIRIFDALNDIRNLSTAINAAKKYGAHLQAAISYTTGDVFNNEYFVNYAKALENEGADSICIKDMAGLLTPYSAFDLVSALKKGVSVPIQIHSHYTSGLGSMVLLKSVEAGADVVDTALSPLALGTSHTPTESFIATLRGTEFDTGLDLSAVNDLSAYFTTLREKYIANGLLDPKVLAVSAKTLLYQVPGGMLSNLVSQLKQAGKIELLNDVLNEVPRVRADAGFPPLVTPTSQIVGTQAVYNIITGERYKMVTKEFKGLVRGEYGKTPVEISKDFRNKIIGDQSPITCRPADLLEPELDKIRSECAGYARNDEDVLSYAQFGPVALKYFKNRDALENGVKGEDINTETKVAPV